MSRLHRHIFLITCFIPETMLDAGEDTNINKIHLEMKDAKSSRILFGGHGKLIITVG